MDRNRWETAIHCLEVALHPNTSRDEAVAAVNGFRRLAGGTPLSEMCLGFAGVEATGPAGDLAARLDRLSRENLVLRRQLERTETRQSAAVRRIGETEARICALRDELHAAHLRANAAEARLADLRTAHEQIADELKDEILALGGALDRVRRDGAPAKAAPQFHELLAAARKGDGEAQFPARHPAPPAHSPWTA